MTAATYVDHRFNPGYFKKLAEHPAIEEIENMDMDDGRFFVHLKKEYRWCLREDNCTQSFGNIKEVRAALKNIKEVTE